MESRSLRTNCRVTIFCDFNNLAVARKPVHAQKSMVMNRNVLIDSLNAAIRIEHTLSMQCYQQALTVRGLWRLQLNPYFEAMGKEASDHARKFGEKVVALGGIPVVDVGTVTLSEKPDDMLQDNLRLEHQAMAAYREVLALVEEDNLPLRTMLEDHIEAEQRHIEELELLIGGAATQSSSQTVRRVS